MLERAIIEGVLDVSMSNTSPMHHYALRGMKNRTQISIRVNPFDLWSSVFSFLGSSFLSPVQTV